MTRAACHASPQRRDDRSAVDCLIDSGAGTFGDETVLVDGKKAAIDIVAPAKFDCNAVGTFDALDVRYASVRVRRGLNQDGISRADGLQGLAASSVQNIEPADTASAAKCTDAILARR